MQYHLAPLFCRPWTLMGITIESHYEGNYGSALRRLNAVTEELEALDPATASIEVINRLKRDEAVALNSTLLHELYFASLGGDRRGIPDAMANALARDFGSVERWRREFMALAEGLASGSGWVLLTYLPRDGRLINQSACDHNQNLPDPCHRHVRTRLSHRLRRQCDGLHRRLHAQHRMERRPGPLRRRDESGAPQAARAKGIY